MKNDWGSLMMLNKKVCLVGGSEDDKVYLEKRGLEVTYFSNVEEGRKHLMAGNVLNYSITLVRGAGEEAIQKLRGFASSISGPGQYGGVGCYGDSGYAAYAFGRFKKEVGAGHIARGVVDNSGVALRKVLEVCDLIIRQLPTSLQALGRSPHGDVGAR